jgi:hypothetical protein
MARSPSKPFIRPAGWSLEPFIKQTIISSIGSAARVRLASFQVPAVIACMMLPGFPPFPQPTRAWSSLVAS